LIVNFYPELPYLGYSYSQRVLYRNEFRKGFAAKKANATQARFISKSKPAIELYDLEKDPFEIKNLAESSEHQKIRKQLRTVLDTWMKGMGDEYRDHRKNGEPLKAMVKIKDVMKNIK